MFNTEQVNDKMVDVVPLVEAALERHKDDADLVAGCVCVFSSRCGFSKSNAGLLVKMVPVCVSALDRHPGSRDLVVTCLRFFRGMAFAEEVGADLEFVAIVPGLIPVLQRHKDSLEVAAQFAGFVCNLMRFRGNRATLAKVAPVLLELLGLHVDSVDSVDLVGFVASCFVNLTARDDLPPEGMGAVSALTTALQRHAACTKVALLCVGFFENLILGAHRVVATQVMTEAGVLPVVAAAVGYNPDHAELQAKYVSLCLVLAPKAETDTKGDGGGDGGGGRRECARSNEEEEE
jgi:uncharacterized protein YejL (UPF0352 family)